MKTKIITAISLFSFIATGLYAQIAINNTATNPDASAILDLNSGNSGVNKGFLPPQVSLTDVNSASPITSPATGLVVYSKTAPMGGSGIGYYFWSGTAWVNLSGATGGGISGAGMASYLTRWTGASTLGYSVIEDDGANVGINVNPVVGLKLYVRASSGTAINGTVTDALGYGVAGYNSASSGIGIYGAGSTYAVYGDGSFYGNGSGGYFYDGKEIAVLADHTKQFGINAYGRTGGGYFAGSHNEYAYAGWNGYGVYGYSKTIYNWGAGVYGEDDSAYGVWGVNRTSPYAAVDGDVSVDGGTGVQGHAMTIRSYPVIAWNSYMGAQPLTGMLYTLCSHSGASVQVNYYDGATQWKITGDGSVATVVNNTHGEQVRLVAPEAPEIYFEDYGSGQLVNGKAHINLDADLAANITVNDKHPLRVFIQLENNESCNGVVIKNKTATGFDVVELNGGASNTPFEWHMVANRADQAMNNGMVSRNADVRFAKVNTQAETELKASMQKQSAATPPPVPAALTEDQPVKNTAIQGANGTNNK